MKNLLVVRSQCVAEKIGRELGDGWRVISVGSVPCGERYKAIIVAADLSEGWEQKWFDEAIRCRIYSKDGTIAFTN